MNTDGIPKQMTSKIYYEILQINLKQFISDIEEDKAVE